ncbi:MAG: hypothetical protein JXR83_02755 [Deltaproteobacteria bacterium]|nr:hypothetical protein [Deltaproteobacteria bacterium]
MNSRPENDATAPRKSDQKRLLLFGALSFGYGVLLLVAGLVTTAHLSMAARRYVEGQQASELATNLAGVAVVAVLMLVYLPGIAWGLKARALAIGLQDFGAGPAASSAAMGLAAFHPHYCMLWIGYFGLVLCIFDAVVGLLLDGAGYFVLALG